MFIVAGKPFDISIIINEYTENSVESKLLKQMSASTETYQYDSLNMLKFELQLRREIVNAAIALNNSRMSFAVFHDSRCNPVYWDRTDNGGFSLKQGAVPSDAINDIFINGRKYATECATAMVIVYYKALLETFGKELFNKTFPSIYLMNWRVTDRLLREIGTPKKTAEILLGDRAYFANPDVNPMTPEWQGENVIVLPNGLYYGHGIGITTSDRIIDALNSQRKAGATVSAYLMNSVGRPNFRKLANIYYGTTVQRTAVLDEEVQSVTAESEEVQSVMAESEEVQSVMAESEEVQSVTAESEEVQSVTAESEEVQSVTAESEEIQSVMAESEEVQSVTAESEEVQDTTLVWKPFPTAISMH